MQKGHEALNVIAFKGNKPAGSVNSWVDRLIWNLWFLQSFGEHSLCAGPWDFPGSVSHFSSYFVFLEDTTLYTSVFPREGEEKKGWSTA